MTTKDLHTYAVNNWGPFSKTITAVSDSGDGGSPLVESELQIYHFDAICKSLFGEKYTPTSADGIAVTKRCIDLIEFKSGFKQRITKQNFNPEKWYCKIAKKECKDGGELFLENQRHKIKELITNLRFKAIESYITLDRYILPRCKEGVAGASLNIRLIVVVDGDEVDEMEDTLAGLAGVEDSSNNCLASIRKAIKRLEKLCDMTGVTYYYDSIVVMSAQDFSNKLKMFA